MTRPRPIRRGFLSSPESASGQRLSYLAAVWTGQPEYVPGTVITLSGDNGDDAGYQSGETVHVDVVGPNASAFAPR